MLFGDVPIFLINLALVAIISLPFVVVACATYIAKAVVRPGWALYHHQREHSVAVQALPPRAPDAAEHHAKPHRRMHMSAFGR